VATKISDVRGQAAAHCNVGVVLDRMGQYDKAIEEHEKGLALTKVCKDSRGEAMSLGNLGIAHRHKGNHTQALDCQEQRLKLVKRMKDKRAVAVTLSNMALSYDRMGDVEKAKEYNEESLRISKRLGDTAAVQTISSRLSTNRAKDDKGKEPTSPDSRASQYMTSYGKPDVHATLMDNPLEALNFTSLGACTSTREFGKTRRSLVSSSDGLDMDEVEMTLADPFTEASTVPESLTEMNDDIAILHL